jgi:DNA-binding Xre family transcriptional regulator
LLLYFTINIPCNLIIILTFGIILCDISMIFCIFSKKFMLGFNIKPIFQARGIERPYTFLVKAGLSPHSANSILNSTTRTIRLDHVELLCRVLVCEPNDLLFWIPNSGENLSDNHPLNKLKQVEAAIDLKQTIENMPYRELKEATRTIIGNNKTTE